MILGQSASKHTMQDLGGGVLALIIVVQLTRFLLSEITSMYSQAGHAWQEMILCAGEKPLAFEASALLPRYPPADVAGCSSVEIAQVHVASVQQVICVSDGCWRMQP